MQTLLPIKHQLIIVDQSRFGMNWHSETTFFTNRQARRPQPEAATTRTRVTRACSKKWCHHVSSFLYPKTEKSRKNGPPNQSIPPTSHWWPWPWHAMALWGDQRWSPRWAGRPTALGCHRNFAKESPGHWSSIRHPALQKGAMRLCQTSLLWVSTVYLVFSSPQHQENHGLWLFDLKPPFTMVLVCLEKRRWWSLRTPQLHWIIIFWDSTCTFRYCLELWNTIWLITSTFCHPIIPIKMKNTANGK